jgi:hypothetical protein
MTMDPDKALQLLQDALESGQLTEARTHFNDLDVWLLSGGFIPSRWGAAQVYDPNAPRPDVELDAFVHCKKGAFAVSVAGKAYGTQATLVDAEERLDALLADMEYWPYVWTVDASGVPRLVDTHPAAYTWWLASKPSRDEFTYGQSEEVLPEKVHATQRDITDKNAALGWQKWRIVRRELPAAVPAEQWCQYGQAARQCMLKATSVRHDPESDANLFVCSLHAHRMDKAAREHVTAGAGRTRRTVNQ